MGSSSQEVVVGSNTKSLELNTQVIETPSVVPDKLLNLSELYLFICQMRITLVLRSLDETVYVKLRSGREQTPSLFLRS